MKYPKLNLGQIEAIVNKLGGMEGVKRFLAGTIANLPVWKTVILGEPLLSNTGIVAALTAGGHHSCVHTSDILRAKGALVTARTEIDLCVATVKELTGRDRADKADILNAIEALGYQLCPVEVGPRLRLLYTEQPDRERLHIASAPLPDWEKAHFVVHKDATDRTHSCVGVDYTTPSQGWPGDSRWVFAKPRE